MTLLPDLLQLGPGDELGGYHIVAPIGAGGMGQVYVVERISDSRWFALKSLPESATNDKEFVERFEAEARVMAKLDHPHIVKVYESGFDQGRYFYVMDFVTTQWRPPDYVPEGFRADGADSEVTAATPSGGSTDPDEHDGDDASGEPDRGAMPTLDLSQLLSRMPGHRIEEDLAFRWVCQIASALDHAHQHGVVHRDLKPANLLVDPEGDLQLTDFGLARVLGDDFILGQAENTMSSMGGEASFALAQGVSFESSSEESHSTREWSIMGTYDYMAPEQREPGAAIDARTDVYAFGLLMYRILCGQLPPRGRAKPIAEIVAGIERDWDGVIFRCIEQDPGDRFQSMQEVLAALRKRRWPLRAIKTVAAIAVLGAAVYFGRGLLAGSGETATGDSPGNGSGSGIVARDFKAKANGRWNEFERDWSTALLGSLKEFDEDGYKNRDVDTRIDNVRRKIAVETLGEGEYDEADDALGKVRDQLKELKSAQATAITNYREAIREIRDDHVRKVEPHANFPRSEFEEVRVARVAGLKDWEELADELNRGLPEDGPVPASLKACRDQPTRYRERAQKLIERLDEIRSEEVARASGLAGSQSLELVRRYLDARDASAARDSARVAVVRLKAAAKWAGNDLVEAESFRLWLEEAEDLPSASRLAEAVRSWVSAIAPRFAPGNTLLLMQRTQVDDVAGDPYEFDVDLATELAAPFPDESGWRIAAKPEAPVYRMAVTVDPTGEAKFPTVAVCMATVGGEAVAEKKWRLWPSTDTDDALLATVKRGEPARDDTKQLAARAEWVKFDAWKRAQKDKDGKPVLPETWSYRPRDLPGGKREIEIERIEELQDGLARLTVTSRAEPGGRADTCEMILIPASPGHAAFLIDREELTVVRAKNFLGPQDGHPSISIDRYFKGDRKWNYRSKLNLLQGLDEKNAATFAEQSGRELAREAEWLHAKKISDGLPRNAAVLNLDGGVSEWLEGSTLIGWRGDTSKGDRISFPVAANHAFGIRTIIRLDRVSNPDG